MVIVTKINGSKVKIKLSEFSGYKQSDGKYRVTFKDGSYGVVTENPCIENEDGMLNEYTEK